MSNIWHCASQAYDLVTAAKKHIDAGEIGYGADEFTAARLNLRDAIELLDAIMAETRHEKAADIETKAMLGGNLQVITRGNFHLISGNCPAEMPSDDLASRPLLPGERSAELP
jgi:hypothetical protein